MKKLITKYILKEEPPVGSIKFFVSNILVSSFEIIILTYILYVFGGYHFLNAITSGDVFTWKDWAIVIAGIGFFPIVLMQFIELVSDIRKALLMRAN